MDSTRQISYGLHSKPPALAFVGNSGTGKTTLLCGVLRILRSRGLRVGVIKHSGGFHVPDKPGKDSFRLREAGATELVLGSKDATVFFGHHPGAEPEFERRMALLDPHLDLVLVESYRSAQLPAIEVLRSGHSEAVKMRETENLLAVAADFQPEGIAVPCLPLDEANQVADFICRTVPALQA
ncbi:MAG: molybdopterin-guanine dinucleotide biosynthesis protein B [Planctomycetota bacterium]|nr:MAG: molybdopterin-guanine dinucleotide biosynthesis protein B [Planctomycetota bacterium]